LPGNVLRLLSLGSFVATLLKPMPVTRSIRLLGRSVSHYIVDFRMIRARASNSRIRCDRRAAPHATTDRRRALTKRVGVPATRGRPCCESVYRIGKERRRLIDLSMIRMRFECCDLAGSSEICSRVDRARSIPARLTPPPSTP
jgi:hypothetical protein